MGWGRFTEYISLNSFHRIYFHRISFHRKFVSWVLFLRNSLHRMTFRVVVVLSYLIKKDLLESQDQLYNLHLVKLKCFIYIHIGIIFIYVLFMFMFFQQIPSVSILQLLAWFYHLCCLCF